MSKRSPYYTAAFAATALLLTGCASINPTGFKGPNGRDAYVMQCSGLGRTLEQCYQLVPTLCPSGYDIIDSRSSVAGVSTASGGMVAGPRHSLAVECR